MNPTQIDLYRIATLQAATIKIVSDADYYGDGSAEYLSPSCHKLVHSFLEHCYAIPNLLPETNNQ